MERTRCDSALGQHAVRNTSRTVAPLTASRQPSTRAPLASTATRACRIPGRSVTACARVGVKLPLRLDESSRRVEQNLQLIRKLVRSALGSRCRRVLMMCRSSNHQLRCPVRILLQVRRKQCAAHDVEFFLVHGTRIAQRRAAPHNLFQSLRDGRGRCASRRYKCPIAQLINEFPQIVARRPNANIIPADQPPTSFPPL